MNTSTLNRLFHHLCILVICLLSFAHNSSSQAAESYIAIAAAYEPETAAIKKIFNIDSKKVTTRKYLGITFEAFDYRGKKLLFFTTGMSLTNAAMSVQLAFDKFPISTFLFAGVAGGINPDLSPGDVTVPSRWIYHGEAAYFNPKPDGSYHVASYFKPRYPNFGMQFPDDVLVIREGMKKPVRKPYFEADPKLLSFARKAVRTLPERKVGDRAIRYKIGGAGVAGTVFMDNAEYRKFVWKTWKADSLDMESTAYAHVAWVNRKPFLIVRALSDLAGGQEGLNQIDAFEKISSENAAYLLRAIVDQI